MKTEHQGAKNLERGRRKFTEENAAEAGRKGGLKSAETRQKRKALRELLEVALKMPSERRDMSRAESMVAALIERAEDGDTKAFEIVRDTVGEKPVQSVDLASSDGSMSPVPAIDLGNRDHAELIELTRRAWGREVKTV